MRLILTWIDNRGREVPDDEIVGYNAADFFSESGLVNARCLLGEGLKMAAEEFLDRTYKGADVDGIGLRWQIAED